MKLTRLIAAIFLLTFAMMPTESWAPTQVFPTSAGVSPTTQNTTTTGYGKQWSIPATSPVIPGCAEFTDDTNLTGYAAPSATSFATMHSSNGGQNWETDVTVGGQPASSFGAITNCFRINNGSQILFTFTNATGGFSIASSPSGPIGTWSIGPAGGGNLTGRAGAQGPNGTIVVVRDNGSICRSTNAGVSWSCPVNASVGQVLNGSMFALGSNIWLFQSGNPNNIMRSVDDGQSFTSVLVPTNGSNGMKCLSANGAQSICFAAAGGLSAGTIIQSTDGGATWSTVFSSNSTWGNRIQDPGNTVGWADFGGGIMTITRPTTTIPQLVGYRTVDAGTTWVPLPNLQFTPGGTNASGVAVPVVRGGRAWSANFTLENINANLYVPVTAAGSTTIADNSGQVLNLKATAAGQVQIPVFQGEGPTDSTQQPWFVATASRNPATPALITPAANTAATFSIAGAANQRTHIYSLEAYCSAGASTAVSTINDATGGILWQAPIGAIPAAPASLRREWPVALTSSLNSTMTVTASACGVGNNTVLSVHADRY